YVGLAALWVLGSPDIPASDAPAKGSTIPRSGIYPHLAMFNEENECGTGGVVAWADRLWVVTYAPHKPRGSTDKLYEIDRSLERTTRPESVGGTPANRMIHRESGQLFLGPYVIDSKRDVRVLSPDRMPGRLTGNARHLTDPAHRIYCATMEEGFYDIDVRSLALRVIAPDANGFPDHAGTLLPGYHGKGLYSGQGRLVYANNGELSPEAQRRPDIESGCLAEWDGSRWHVIRRNQFTEVTGPGGLEGNPRPDSDPIWSIGWDHRSLLLLLLDHGVWHAYRLPKSSHSYDGAHGWNTEWPRIRDIGERDLLMTMHGAFWRFPRTFSAARSAGLEPRANYLKVVGDFCRWNDRIVFGCDDAARSEFLNVRPAKGGLAPPGKSQSNLWFARPSDIDHLGPVLGRGAVWSREDVLAGVPSDPYLFDGYEHRALHLTHGTDKDVTFRLEVDRKGDGRWSVSRRIRVEARRSVWVPFDSGERGAWIRLVPEDTASRVTAQFTYRNRDPRTSRPAGPFREGKPFRDRAQGAAGGLLHAGGGERPVLRYLARDGAGNEDLGCYALDGSMTLRPTEDPGAAEFLRSRAAIPRGVLGMDAASVIYRDARGTWRLPRADDSFDAEIGLDRERVCREVTTERDLFNAHGTFYELPAENAGGFAKVRPVATHARHIADYASYRGLLVLAGWAPEPSDKSPHWVRSTDGRCALWVGNVE
ncbi:MAG: hypothetical protein JNL97_08780, partial [Verrucomicrobiales bacterium]|nr:hypothetical protein [Verrucomicrobiales bacterium]